MAQKASWECLQWRILFMAFWWSSDTLEATQAFAEGFPEQMSCVVCGGRSKYSWGAKRKMVLARSVEDFQSG